MRESSQLDAQSWQAKLRKVKEDFKRKLKLGWSWKALQSQQVKERIFTHKDSIVGKGQTSGFN